MKEVKVKLYRFDELSKDARHEVCERERQQTNNWGTISQEHDAEERISTLQKFCEVFGIKYKLDYDHDRRFISWHFKDSEIDSHEISGKYLWRFLDNYYYDIRSRKYFATNFRQDENGKMYYKHRHSRIMWEEQNCPLTGMCYDCDILDKIFDWYKKPDWKLSLHDLFEDCFSHYLKLWEEEDDYIVSDENISDLIEANLGDKLYYEDGTEFNGIYEEAA